MPQLFGLRNGSSSRGKSSKKASCLLPHTQEGVYNRLTLQKSPKHCYFQSSQDYHLAREAIHKLQLEIDALKIHPSQDKSTKPITSQEDDLHLQPLSPATELRIISLEMSQDEIRLSIAEKRNQLSSLRVFPVEVFDDILMYAHIHYQVPRRDLALVCRAWHLAVLSIPRIWSNISLISAVVNSPKPVEWLKRRLELAKNVPLDVTLSATGSSLFAPEYPESVRRKKGISLKTIKRLHKVVITSGTERWRSLTIIDGTRSGDMTMNINPMSPSIDAVENAELRSWVSAKVQGAKFPRLRRLDIQNYTYFPLHDVYVQLYDAIGLTATSLEGCFLHEGQVPLGFLKEPGTSFQGLLELKAGSLMLDVPIVSNTVRYLDVPSADFPLVDFSMITDLTLKTFSSAGTIYFQGLTNLYVAIPSPALFQELRAPNLRKLVLGQYQDPSIVSRTPFTGGSSYSYMQGITDFMRNSSNSPSIFPIILQIQGETTTEYISHILERWSQLQHISIRMDQSQNSFETLRQLETLLKARDTVNGETGPNAQATWKACPLLRTLHFDSGFVHSDGSSETYGVDYGYEEMARAVAFSRRRSPLQEITWDVKGTRGRFSLNE